MTLNFLNNNYNMNANIYTRHYSEYLNKSNITKKGVSSLYKSHKDTPQRIPNNFICFVTTICITFMISTAPLANDATTTETCANGSGTIIIGVVTGTKYCKSNKEVNWWNAYTWCDGITMELVNTADCHCSNMTSDCANNNCPEFKENLSNWCWLNSTDKNTQNPYIANGRTLTPLTKTNVSSALCKVK